MAKLGRDKVALFLACTSILGGKIQAMDANKAKTPQTVAAVGGASKDGEKTSNLTKVIKALKEMPVWAKVLASVGSGGILAVGCIVSSLCIRKNNDEIDGSKLDKYKNIAAIRKSIINGCYKKCLKVFDRIISELIGYKNNKLLDRFDGFLLRQNGVNGKFIKSKEGLNLDEIINELNNILCGDIKVDHIAPGGYSSFRLFSFCVNGLRYILEYNMDDNNKFSISIEDDSNKTMKTIYFDFNAKK